MDEVMIIEQLRRQNEALTYEIEAMKYNLTEDLLCAEEEIAALRNPWRTDLPPKVHDEEFIVLWNEGCASTLHWDSGAEGYEDENGNVVSKTGLNAWIGWMPIPAPNEVK